MKKTYRGRRLCAARRSPAGGVVGVRDAASGVLVRVEESDGRVRDLDPCHKIRNHSPDGFNWGYGGSGPAQLALAICVDALGEPKGRDPKVYQAFKRQFVARWKDRWEITASEVIDWFLDKVFSGPPPAEGGEE